MIQVESITFNHDPTGASTDAINIRRNAAEWVNVPEWQRGVSLNPEDSPAAYARDVVGGNTISIQATFSNASHDHRSVHMRAVDNVVTPPGPSGCIGWLTWLLTSIIRALVGNVLGEVAPAAVTFTNGTSGPVTFTLSGAKVGVSPVGIHTTEWRWQYRVGSGSWHDITVTKHRIYIVLALPEAPWQQSPYSPSNTQLPWTDVLDVACSWGTLAGDLDSAAADVATHVYALGPATISYDCPGYGSSHYSNGSFDCTSFLDRMRGGPGLGIYVNCTDCATIVTTFSNVLGCQLWSSKMGWSFDLNEMQAIGDSTFELARGGWTNFTYHEVAWKGACGVDDNVFDACLMVDGDADPVNPPHVPTLELNVRFGNPGDLTYRDRLAAPSGRPSCQPQPTTRVRRSVQ